MDDKPNYYAIIPARIRYDPNLTNLSKLLYAEITALSNKEGFCWATNSYFAKIYGVTITTISISISKLAKLNYVKVENEYKGKQIIRRKITITELDIPIKENLKRGITICDTPKPTKYDKDRIRNHCRNNPLFKGAQGNLGFLFGKIIRSGNKIVKTAGQTEPRQVSGGFHVRAQRP